MKRRRELIVANGAALLVLLIVLLFGWRDAAVFGLFVLVMMDLVVIIRERFVGPHEDSER